MGCWCVSVLQTLQRCKKRTPQHHPRFVLSAVAASLSSGNEMLKTRLTKPFALYSAMPEPQNLTSLSSPRSLLCFVLELKVKTLSPTWPPLPPAMLGLKRHELETGVLSAGIHALCRSILFSDLSKGQMYLQWVSQSLKVHFCLSNCILELIVFL